MSAQSASADRQHRRMMRMAGWIAVAGLMAMLAFAPTARAGDSTGGDCGGRFERIASTR